MENLKKNKMKNSVKAVVEQVKTINENDPYIKQDNEDLLYLEERYEKLEIPYRQRMIIDDYIACMKTRDERYANLSYIAGIKDTLSLLKETGMLAGKN